MLCASQWAIKIYPKAMWQFMINLATFPSRCYYHTLSVFLQQFVNSLRRKSRCYFVALFNSVIAVYSVILLCTVYCLYALIATELYLSV